jgi:hypothetical protein
MQAMTSIGGWGPLSEVVRDMASERLRRGLLERHDRTLATLTAPPHRVPLENMVRLSKAAAFKVGAETFADALFWWRSSI